MMRAVWRALWLAGALLGGAATHAQVSSFALPPVCVRQPPLAPDARPIADIRKEIEAIGESDPTRAVALLCATIPRVGREQGEDSLEFAWWVQTLATPLIAYLNEFSEAIPLLEYARPILERHLGPDAPEIAEIHVAYGWIAFRQGHLADAGDAWAAALRIREKVPGARKIDLQKALVGLAQVRMAQRRFADARALLERAQAILAANGETESEAAGAIENALTNVAMREENYPLARRHAEAQVAIELALRARHGPAQPVTAYILYGQVLEKMDEYEAAERALREAVRFSEAADGPLQRQHLRALTSLGALLNARGKPQEALPFAKRALEVAERQLGSSAPNLAAVLLNLADIERNLGELPQALAAYERAGQIIGAHPDDVERQVQVQYQRGYGALQALLGAPAESRAALARGLDLVGVDPSLSTGRAALLLGLARLDAAHDPVLARNELTEALALFGAHLPAEHPTILRVVNELCSLELRATPHVTPHCSEAQHRLESARDVDPALRHAVYANASALAEARGNTVAAYSLAVRALSAAATLGTPDPQWIAQIRLAQLLHDRGDGPLAIFFGKQSIGQIERQRAWFAGEGTPLVGGFLRDKVAAYRTVADWLMQAGRIDEGLEVLDLLKGEELHEFVPRGATRAGDRGERTHRIELTSAEQALWTRYLTALHANAQAGAEIETLTRRLEGGKISPAERARLTALLQGQRETENARTERLDRFIAGAGGAARVPGEKRISADRLTREIERFGPDTALGVYLLSAHHLRLLIATHDRQAEYRIDLEAESLRREIGELLDAIRRREDIRARSRTLYDTLMRPLADAAAAAGATRLVLWPDDALRYIPFAALFDGRQYLIERFALQLYAEAAPPSQAASVKRVARPVGTDERTVRVLGVTRAVGDFDALPAVADELCHIVRGPIIGLASPGDACLPAQGQSPPAGEGALPGLGYADGAFTEARFDALLDGPRDFSILHIGTHFSLRPGNAMRSYLLLGDGATLTLAKINELDFDGIDLATLSGCQTGMAGAVGTDGREIEGLSAIVQQRGARSVIATLWRVEDRSTASLMELFYDAMSRRPGADSGDIARALRAAQLSLIGRHPFYWAGFILTGR